MDEEYFLLDAEDLEQQLDPDARLDSRISLNQVVLPNLDTLGSDAGTESHSIRSREPEFVKYRSLWNNQMTMRGQEHRVDDVRCMFNMVHNIARPVLQQDASLQESTVAPRTADQLLLDLQQLGLVRDKSGSVGDAALDSRADQEPILKDLKLIQENPMEHPVFHCFLRELSIDRRVGVYLVTIEQLEDAFVMMAYQEPSEGQATMVGMELARFPKFPKITDGFCLSANGDSVVFTCTLLGCVVFASLSGSAVEVEPALGAGNAPDQGNDAGIGGDELGLARPSMELGRKDQRDNQSRNSSHSSIEATGSDHAFNFQVGRSVTVAESSYKLSELISEHVYDVCIREISHATSGTYKCNLYVTNKTNIAVINMSGLKLDNFLFEGLRLPWRLKLYKHLLIIAEKWGSVQIADLEKEHRSLCVTDMQGLSCENGLKSIEVVPEHNLLLLTVYPEGNQAAGRYLDDGGSTTGASSGTTAASAETRVGGGGAPGRWLQGDNGEESSWSCHCFHFHPESTHGNPMLRYAQTLRLSRSPLTSVYSEVSKRLYILCFHPARNNSSLLLNKLEVFHEERLRTAKFTAKQLLPQKDEEEYLAAVDGLAGRRAGNNEAGKVVEMLDLAGSSVVATIKAPIVMGFK